MWTPITLEELHSKILSHEAELSGKELDFWNMIRIAPQKWTEKDYGSGADAFWAVGLIGNQVLWYNDIEEGFNVSPFSSYGKIDQYACNQDEFYLAVRELVRLNEIRKLS